MLRTALRSKTAAVITTAIVTASVVGGIAYAASSPIDSGGVIHGCYNPTTGAMKLRTGATCPATGMKTPISWNSQGVQGVQGDKGDQGTSGMPGEDAQLTGASVYAAGPGWVQVPNGLVEKIVPWDAVTYDSDTYFDPAFPTRLAVKTRGLYSVEGQVLWADASTGHRYIRILKNGDPLGWAMEAGAFNDGDWTPQRTTTQMVLNGGDYIELAAQQDSGATLGLVTVANLGPSMTITRLGDVPGE